MQKFPISDRFVARHMDTNQTQLQNILQLVGTQTFEELITQTIPDDIRIKKELNLPASLSEFEYLKAIKKIANKNIVARSYIGMGYYGTITPSVILRNVLENPGWYTPYTPYQAEISQGRLEALLNFQTMVNGLTGLPIANASLLDESTSAAEAMNMFYHSKNKRAKGDKIANIFLVSDEVLPQTIDVLKTRALPRGIEIVVLAEKEMKFTDKVFGVLFQYPGKTGGINELPKFAKKAKDAGVFVTVAADLLSLTLLTPPGEWGADAVVGTTQRMGIPFGFGGPHAAYFATTEKFKRLLPGRIIGVSTDVDGNKALRMALQTREQHIRREKATSNICTAQALLASMAGMFAVYHGADGLKSIANRIHQMARALNLGLKSLGYTQTNRYFFDTLNIEADSQLITQVKKFAKAQKINFFYTKKTIQVSLDETVLDGDLQDVLDIFAKAKKTTYVLKKARKGDALPNKLTRSSEYLDHPTFVKHRTETKMMRYLKSLENKDLSLTHSMVSLGSCTMKLNAATEMLPVTWPEFANIHPFAPATQTKGYQQLIQELGDYLCEITGLSACSFQPNSGAQGEFAGLMTIRAYHHDRNDDQRDVILIPSSAHGTNPASAIMAGMKVVVIACDEKGNVDLTDMQKQVATYKDNLAGFMITYPSTHGVFETGIKKMVKLIHDNGGLVYLDGANMNAQVGYTNPGAIGADVCHLNLHKTFAIPHGGGGPGVGPICVNDKLAPYLPGHPLVKTGGKKAISAGSSAPYGSAGVLVVSHAYISMLGRKGLKLATDYAILNANYIKARLEKEYTVLYKGDCNRVAHELIIDLRPMKAFASAEDVAKRLMDYGFHAPTLSFPVAGTIMIEPTESESQEELDRFCDALLAIKKEIDEIAHGDYPADNNVLHNAPHTQQLVLANDWDLPYSREKAAFPRPWLKTENKFWVSVRRIDQARGDRNLICTCPPMEEYLENT